MAHSLFVSHRKPSSPAPNAEGSTVSGLLRQSAGGFALGLSLFVVGCEPIASTTDAHSLDGAPGALDMGPGTGEDVPLVETCLGDADRDTLSLAEEGSGDPDGDGVPNSGDDDSDGDGIADLDEAGDTDCASPPIDSDDDGIPDYLDLDSDDDTLSDRDEGAGESDGDGTPDYLDLDSDGDGVSDAVEAGDADLETPPASCPAEVSSDGLADFVDADSDGDGLGDGEEFALGTSPCDVDSDDDGAEDLVEAAYQHLDCPDGVSGTTCGCATRSDCVAPADLEYVVLPYEGAAVERDLDSSTEIRDLDVFFLPDTTSSMGGTLNRLRDTLAPAGTGLIDRIRETVPNAWFGGGYFQDFPFGAYGSAGDEPFGLAAVMTPPERRSEVDSGFGALSVRGGADGPEAHAEAIYQTMTGAGATWTHGGGGTYTARRFAADCLGSRWGAPCFRESAMAIIVLFSDICAHQGPPGEFSGCDPYTGIDPVAADWSDGIAEMTRHAARFVGISAGSGSRCAIALGGTDNSPCHFMRRTAEATGSVDLDGNALVYDLPSGGASDTVFVDTVVGAIETAVTRTRFDIETTVRDDPGALGTATSRFVQSRQPACLAAPPTDPCWTEPVGVSHEQAVLGQTASGFSGVLPGTRLMFRIVFRNDFYPADTTSHTFVTFIETRTGTALLDTRRVVIIVPARSTD